MSTTELTPPVPTVAGPIRVGDIPGLMPRRAWIALSPEDEPMSGDIICASPTPCCAAPAEPSPACCTGPPGDEDTSTAHADTTTNAANQNRHDLQLQ